MNDFREHLAMLVSNYEAALRSDYEGIVNVRVNCVGLMRVI